MKFMICIVTILWTFNAFATEPITYYMKTKSRKVKKIYFQKTTSGFLVETRCFKKISNCESLERIKKYKKIKFKNTLHSNGTIRNPASQFCSEIGGRNIILEDFKLNDYDFCMFKDKSMILSRDLLRKMTFKKDS